MPMNFFKTYCNAMHPIGFSLLVFIFLFDRATKWLAMSTVSDKVFVIIPDVLQLELVYNKNIVGLLSWSRFVIVAIVITFLLVLMWSAWVSYRDGRAQELFGFLLMILGALSNVFDRLVFGGVIDFINVASRSIFNIADVMIIAGAVIAVLAQSQKER